MRLFLAMRTLVVWALLAGAAVFFSRQTFEIWAPDGLRVSESGEPTVRSTPRSLGVARAPRAAAYRPQPAYGVYDVVSRRNLFANDRGAETVGEVTAPAFSAPRLPSMPLDSRFALFGVVIEDGRKRALVWNLGKRTPADRDEVWVKIGDVLGNLSIVAIEAGRIVVSDGSTEHVVRLVDGAHQKRRGGVPPAGPRTGVKSIEVRAPAGTGRGTGAAEPPAVPEADKPPEQASQR